MVERADTTPGRYETRTSSVSVRRPPIHGGGSVSLKDPETVPTLAPRWDEHLTFEPNGKAPGVASIEVRPIADAVTVYRAGDSTVTDMRREPWSS